MSGRDLQRARKTAKRREDDAYAAAKLRNAELEAALKPFADAHHAWDRGEVLGGDMGVVGLEHFARAAMALEKKG